MKQESRQRLWTVVFYGSWVLAGVFAWLRVSGTVGQEWGVVTVLWLGFAISAAVRLSRMRLTETMLSVYRAGVETARVQKEERDEMEHRIMEASAQHRESDRA